MKKCLTLFTLVAAGIASAATYRVKLLDPTIVKATTVRTSISEYPGLRFRMANLRVRPG